ncbi:MAG: ParB/RepB/Spo0J family partition protein [Alphaproteobacteria bacterium]|jgi:ParB family chromosome partitioning protein|nr:ParB/RepB/Spo0J family partition protein [Alphaproteobacteria bacterium]
MSTKRGLGRGLEALLADGPAASPEETRRLPIEFLHPFAHQPRRSFDDDDLDALASSIRANGILQPLLVRPLDEFGERYGIVAGERRWRAAQRAGLVEVPVVVRVLDDAQALEVALLENVQRHDLSPLEEAFAYERLIDEYGHTQDALAERVGKSRSHIANLLRLTQLSVRLQAWLEEGQLSVGHARALLVADDPEALARVVIDKGLNVRQTEALVKAEGKRPRLSAPKAEPDPDVEALERRLTARLGLDVQLKTKGTGGRLTIAYSSPEQLDRLLATLDGVSAA